MTFMETTSHSHPSRTHLKIAALAATALLGIGGIAVAFAPGSSATDSPASDTAAATTSKTERVARRHDRRHAALTTAAGALGITAEELKTDLKNGQSIAEVASAKGIDVQTIIDALVAKADARIDMAVTAGKITAEKATTLKTKAVTVATKVVNTKKQ